MSYRKIPFETLLEIFWVLKAGKMLEKHKTVQLWKISLFCLKGQKSTSGLWKIEIQKFSFWDLRIIVQQLISIFSSQIWSVLTFGFEGHLDFVRKFFCYFLGWILSKMCHSRYIFGIRSIFSEYFHGIILLKIFILVSHKTISNQKLHDAMIHVDHNESFFRENVILLYTFLFGINNWIFLELGQ